MFPSRSTATLALAALLALGAPPAAGGGSCDVSGTPGDDHLVGTEAPEHICGLGGDDTIHGMGGADVLEGGMGADTVSGGSGTDLLLGGPDVDDLMGGPGGDYLNGGPDGGQLDGEKGVDSCIDGTAVSCYLPNFGDPNDASGFLDVKQVRSSAGDPTPNWEVVTRPKWTLKAMWDHGYVIVFADTRGNVAPDYFVLAYSVGNDLRGSLYREMQNGGEVRLGGVFVGKSGPRSLVLRLPLDDVVRDRPFFRWSVQTLFTGKKCHIVCFDRSPPAPGLPQAILSAL
jgi:RTX calcium-binding nonapeptide repeat (4 copies)